MQLDGYSELSWPSLETVRIKGFTQGIVSSARHLYSSMRTTRSYYPL